MRIKIKHVFNLIFSFLFGVFLAFCLIFVIYFYQDEVFMYAVVSDSMYPNIKTGAVIVVSPFGQYAKGDVVTYKYQNDELYVITHRVYSVLKFDDSFAYTTKGDNNSYVDPLPVSRHEIVGKVVFIFNYAGYLVHSLAIGLVFYGFLGYLVGIYVYNLVLSEYVKKPAV